MDTKTRAFSDELCKLANSPGTSMFSVNSPGQLTTFTPYNQVRSLQLGKGFKQNANAVVHNHVQPGSDVIVENNQERV